MKKFILTILALLILAMPGWGALEFDGVDQYVKTPSNSIFNLTDMSVVARIYITAGSISGWSRIVSKDNHLEGGTRYVFILRSSGSTGDDKPEFSVYDGTNNPIANSPDAITTGEHLLIGTRDAGVTIKIFVDNVEKASVADTTSGAQGGTTNVSFAALANSVSFDEYSPGKIIEVKIYNRILSAAERNIIYYAHGNDKIINGLVGHWRMNEKTDGQTATAANSVIDISGNNNHGSPSNSPVYRAVSMTLTNPIIN